VVDHTPDKVVKMIDVFHGILKRLMQVSAPDRGGGERPGLGGGCELAIACDMVVAIRGHAKLGQPEIKLGVFPPIAAILLPRQMPMTKVMELLLGGGIIDAAEAHRSAW
jgi:cyclohexa-1,5-dienecarbonyl-CoA hydratase